MTADVMVTPATGDDCERPPPRSEDLNAQSDAAIEFLVGTVDRLESDGVDAAVISESLASVLSVMLASAPVELADRVEAAIFSVVQRRRAATWAAIDAATLG